MHAEPVDRTPHLTLGEGPTWDAVAQRLYWIGIPDRRVQWLEPATGLQGARTLDTMPGTLAPYRDRQVVLATARGFELLDTEADPEAADTDADADPAPEQARTTLVAPVETDRPDRRMNDGKCDPYGRLLAGTMQLEEPRRPGSLYRLEPDGTVLPVLDGLAIPNGLAWPEPDRLWYIDTPTRRIDLFAYPEHGPVGPLIRSLDVSHLPGWPDGMTLDADGNLWVAFWDGAAVHCLSPAGRLLATVELPVPRVTSCAFGGADLDTLYVTTASSPDAAASGLLFSVRGAGGGRPAQPWAGLAPGR
ncbi:SMP-30/gluconolactonase/LRE family protein [Kitasatospora nipponensis]|uniref:SMP-30/gluconolactonase/LRE family protein n=1 Tax=Kitasatospora nipponensis TaxID=258049 RepID=A0ABN1WCG1_9ACTN